MWAPFYIQGYDMVSICGYLTNWFRWLSPHGKDTGSNPVTHTGAVVKFNKTFFAVASKRML